MCLRKSARVVRFLEKEMPKSVLVWKERFTHPELSANAGHATATRATATDAIDSFMMALAMEDRFGKEC